LLEITQVAISVWGADRVGVRIAPSCTYGSMSDSDPAATFRYVVTELDRLSIAYLHVVEPRIKGIEEIAKGQAPIAAQHLRPKFSRALIAAGGFTGETAAAIITAGDADLVAFGRHFISNPDLPERLRRGFPLNRYDRSTFYGGDGRGYIDYPVHADMATV
jgi:N-ethylmaleimide reductase